MDWVETVDVVEVSVVVGSRVEVEDVVVAIVVEEAPEAVDALLTDDGAPVLVSDEDVGVEDSADEVDIVDVAGS